MQTATPTTPPSTLKPPDVVNHGIMASPLKTSTLRDLRFNQDGVSFLVEGQDEVTHLAANTDAAQALEAFYLAALKDLKKQQDSVADLLSTSQMERLAREAAVKGAAVAGPTAAPTEAAKAGMFGWLRAKWNGLLGKSAETLPVAPSVAGRNIVAPLGRATKDIEESPVSQLPVLGGSEQPAQNIFIPVITPPLDSRINPSPERGHLSSDWLASVQVTPAPVEKLAIEEVFADENGVTIRWKGREGSMTYGPNEPVARLLLVAYEKMIEADVKIANVQEIAKIWDEKSKPKAVTAKSPSVPSEEPLSGADYLPMEETGVNFDTLPPDGAGRHEEQDEAVPSAPDEDIAPAAPDVPEAPAVEVTAPEAAVAEASSLENPATMSPLPVRIINEDGSKISIALFQKDGSPVMLNLDDIDAHALKAAINLEDSPRLTHIVRNPHGKDGKESLGLYFDQNLDGPGVSLEEWRLPKPCVGKAAVAQAAPGDSLPELPAAPTKFVTGTKPVGHKDAYP